MTVDLVVTNVTAAVAQRRRLSRHHTRDDCLVGEFLAARGSTVCCEEVLNRCGTPATCVTSSDVLSELIEIRSFHAGLAVIRQGEAGFDAQSCFPEAVLHGGLLHLLTCVVNKAHNR